MFLTGAGYAGCKARRILLMALVMVLAAVGLIPFGAAQAHADGIADDVKGKTYSIATDTTYAPFEFRKDGELVGIDMDLIRAIAKTEGFNVEISSLGFNAALQALDSGQADGVIAGMSITDERKQVYDFSEPYYDGSLTFAVRKDDDSVNDIKDLKGKIVAVKTGTQSEIWAKKEASKYGFTVKSVDQSATIVEMVKSRQAAAAVDDYPVIAYGISQDNGLKTIGKREPVGSYGFAVDKGENQALLAAFNEGLEKLKANGEYDEIIARYVGEDNAAASSGSSKLSFLGLVRQSAPALGLGLRNTLAITVISFVLAMILGIVFGLMRVSRRRWVAAIAKVYVAVFRGTPILVWAFFFYFGVPQLIGHSVSVWFAGAATLALNSGAYLVEIIRGAIQSVDTGQMEGARSLGLTYGQSMARVILPQASKIAMPSVINQLVIMIKDSSLLLAIGFGELLYQAQQLYAANFRVTEMLLMVGVIYFVAITLLTWLANIVDRKVNR